jgi:hypothetical protein
MWWIPLLIITEENLSKWYRPEMPDGYWATTEVPADWLMDVFKLKEKLT